MARRSTFPPAVWPSLLESQRMLESQRRLESERGRATLPRSDSYERRAPERAKLVRVDDDEELVRRCREGDRNAFIQLFRRHRDDVVRLVHRMLGPSADLEDMVQEVFLQVHRSVSAFRGSARFSTWLYRVTVNVVLMHRRSARSRPRFALDSEVPPMIDSDPLP